MTALLRTETEFTALPDDAELLRRVVERDRAAFAQLYDRLSGVLYSTAVRILNDNNEAEDVLQEVFVQIWDKAATYDPRLGRPFNWALTLTRNRSIDRLRSLKLHYEFIAEATETAQATPVFASDAGHEVYQREKSTQVRRALNELPIEQRQALEMAFLGGMTQNEISEKLGQPLGTIKARIRRGMLRLKESLVNWL
jgi:RNA polymerase sigma-70 factor, ECF subfamily